MWYGHVHWKDGEYERRSSSAGAKQEARHISGWALVG